MPGTSPGKSQDDLVLFTEAAANLFAAPDLGERPQSAHRRRPRSSRAGWAFHAKLLFGIPPDDRHLSAPDDHPL